MEKATPVNGVQRAGWSDAADVAALVPLLAETSPRRAHGEHDSQPVLIHADPGSGKTWSIAQMMFMLAQLAAANDDSSDPCFCYDNVPLVVPVQRLAMLVKQGLASIGSLLADFILQEHGKANPQLGQMLLQALQMRVLVLLVDGVDEAAGLREKVEAAVLDDLSWIGARVLVTSRPEGVRVRLFQRRFVMLNLKPLSDKQMLDSVEQQLAGNDFFRHTIAFSAIRAEHDRLYTEQAFPAEPDRARVERWSTPDRFYRAGDSTGAAKQHDPEMRQRDISGSRFIAISPSARTDPQSQYLAGLASGITLDDLARVDQLLCELEAECPDSQTTAKVCALLGAQPDCTGSMSSPQKIMLQLALLVQKCRRNGDAACSCSTLWPEIMARTDELYRVAELCKPYFERLVAAKVSKLGELIWGSLKDPVRVYEKAMDDYAGRFPGDGVLAEACIADMVRARLVCSDCRGQQSILDLIAMGFQTQIDGENCRLEVVRGKNKYRDTDPTHFRNILLNLQLTLRGTVKMFVELQVHHKAILTYNDISHAHDHYNFFRSTLQASYGSQLNELLERMVVFFHSVCRNPVLYSVLIKVVADGEERGFSLDTLLQEFPATLYELYNMGIDAMLRGDGVFGGDASSIAVAKRVLQSVAVANMVATRRQFSTGDAAVALAASAGREVLVSSYQGDRSFHVQRKTCALVCQ